MRGPAARPVPTPLPRRSRPPGPHHHRHRRQLATVLTDHHAYEALTPLRRRLGPARRTAPTPARDQPGPASPRRPRPQEVRTPRR
ncbi:hypothetical protein [Kitasatospora sp. NPDC015120]|uniref:hypothetical protein n=1 Tax=Kitasatospora sp. NPDC015120 TaxID=3364023 RepID=UPI0036F45DDD